jgi:hypothetical protein
VSELEEAAQAKYGKSFKDLSSFAQQEIRIGLSGRQLNMDQVDVAKSFGVLQERIAKLERENKDLWEENEDLRVENLELTDELNKYSSGRSTRNA